jgi:tRNA threonylcarbamoyl adenosine modification protein (Sua5/YciO/YrdC/YwlC family)
MIEYVVEQNPDDRILAKASQILNSGGLLCFPLETNWVAVCDPFQKGGIEKLYRLRHIDDTKHLTILCDHFQKANEVAHINDGAFRLIKKVIPGPYTFIFEANKNITKLLKASRIDKQVGIRFPPSHLCRRLIEVHGKVLLSSHVSYDMFGPDEEDEFPLYGALIEDKFGNIIDMVIDPGEYEFIGSTSIVDFTSGEPEVIREGTGETALFERR